MARPKPKPKSSTARFSPEFKAAAVKRFNADESPTALAKELGISTVSLYTWAGHIKDKGKPKGKRSKPKRPSGDHVSPATREKAMARLREGEKPKVVAKEFGVALPTIYKWRERAGEGVRAAARSGAASKTEALSADELALKKHAPSGDLNTILRDILIYLRDGEREVMALMRSGAIKRPDRAHLMLQLALAEVEKALK